MRGVRRGAVAVGLVHVLLAALALGAVAVWGTGADPARVGLRVTLPDPDPRLPVNADELAIVRPPGTLVLDTTKERRGAWLAAVLPAKEADLLGAAGVVDAKALVARDGDFSAGVWQFAVRDGVDPRRALRAADDLYGAGGWRRAPSQYRGLLVREQERGPGRPLAAYRAHYVLGRYLIRVEAYGPDQAVVDREFAALTGRQLAERPPR